MRELRDPEPKGQGSGFLALRANVHHMIDQLETKVQEGFMCRQGL